MAINGLRSRRVASVGLAAILSAGALAVAGCGGDDEAAPVVCGSLEQLSSDVDELQAIDIGAGESSVAEIEASLDGIVADLETVKADAEEELTEPVAQFQSSVDGFSTEFDAAKADDDLSGEEAQGLLDSLAAVSTSWTSLKDAAPDCEL